MGVDLGVIAHWFWQIISVANRKRIGHEYSSVVSKITVTFAFRKRNFKISLLLSKTNRELQWMAFTGSAPIQCGGSGHFCHKYLVQFQLPGGVLQSPLPLFVTSLLPVFFLVFYLFRANRFYSTGNQRTDLKIVYWHNNLSQNSLLFAWR